MADREGVDVTDRRTTNHPPKPRGLTLELLTFVHRGERKEHRLRATIIDNRPWFVAADLCDLLNQSMLDVAYGGVLVRDRIRVDPRYFPGRQRDLTVSRGGEVWFISESRLYGLVTVNGRHFEWPLEEWVIHEMLPTIRALDTASVERADLPVIRETVKVASRPVNPNPSLNARRAAKKPHSVYRFYDADGALLYVGLTWNVGERIKGHRHAQPWWDEVRDIRVEPHPNSAAAHKAEAAAIRTENPRHNIALKNRV